MLRHDRAQARNETASAASRLLLAAVLAAALAIGGCNKGSMSATSPARSAPSTELPRGDAALRRFADEWGDRYEANRKDKKTALTYTRALRALGMHAQAAAVMQGLAIQNPNDMQVLGEYGKALADAGRLREAAEVLSKAHTPERPNWSILSAQGSVADQIGDHAQRAGFYQSALKIQPGDPMVLSNLGLSYALSRNLPRAESTLREAVSATPRGHARAAESRAGAGAPEANSPKPRKCRVAISRPSTPLRMCRRSAR